MSRSEIEIEDALRSARQGLSFIQQSFEIATGEFTMTPDAAEGLAWMIERISNEIKIAEELLGTAQPKGEV